MLHARFASTMWSQGQQYKPLALFLETKPQAPTYYPVYQGYVDGGIFANNPSLCAVARALEYLGPDATLSDIVVLSIGTGGTSTRIPGLNHDWGFLQWSSWLVSLLFEATENTIDMNMAMMLRNRYNRVECTFSRPIDLDDATRPTINELIAYADHIELSETIDFIQEQVLCPHVHQQQQGSTLPETLHTLPAALDDFIPEWA
eukprot:m.42579 g.42579  ORF g.42579 m.42579 type:complete len:203 (-) comp11556_c0_seq3:66-674(-)